MTSLGLPSLNPVMASFVPAGSSSDTVHSDTPSVSTQVGKAAISALTGGLSDVVTGGSGITVQRVVMLIVGLLLIAAGIFSFKPVRETVIETAKTGAKAAAAA